MGGADQPHLLLIAPWFPPCRGSGVFRALAIANHFVNRGWRVSVLTITEQAALAVNGEIDTSLLEKIDPRVRVLRAPVSLAPWASLHDFHPLRANFPVVHRKARAQLVRHYLDRYTGWLPAFTRTAVAAHRREKFDLILATGGPWTSFASAAALNRLIGVDYVMDYRDAWTLDQFGGGPAFAPDHHAWTWERRFIGRARAIVFVNEGQRDWHAQRYPDAASRMLVIENGYDAGFVGHDLFREPEPGRPLRFGYLGTLTAQYDNAAFWQGWSEAVAEPELADASAELYGYVGFNRQAKAEEILPHRRVPGVRVHGPVPKGEVWKVYRDLDVLLFLVPDSPFVTSGKTYEYMATGKPIVAVHSSTSAAAGPLGGYPLRAGVAEVTADEVKSALLRGASIARTMRRQDSHEALAYAARYERSALLEPLQQRLRELVGAGGAGGAVGSTSQAGAR